MKKLGIVLAGAALIGACSDSSSGSAGDGIGTAAFTTYGEDYIEQEIPAADIEDGWSVKYERFLITISDVSVDFPCWCRSTETNIFMPVEG